jgi:hypothetical protein
MDGDCGGTSAVTRSDYDIVKVILSSAGLRLLYPARTKERSLFTTLDQNRVTFVGR